MRSGTAHMARIMVLVAVALVGTCVSAAEVETASVAYYAETITLDAAGGAAVTVRCSFAGLPKGYGVVMPYAHTVWPDSFVPGEAISEVVTRVVHDRRRLFLVPARDLSVSDTLAFTFDLAKVSSFATETTEDFGTRTVSYRLVQSGEMAVPAMSVCIILPNGQVVNKVVSTVPARKANAPGSPYVIAMRDGRHCVSLKASTVQQGDVLALTIEAKPEAKSPLILVGLGLCAAVYLFLFRDLLKPGNGKPNPAS